jgi:CMP-N,N'-diacetyllegionaminic acid synthase
MKKIIGMIPARLGSKRVPKKNLRYLAGKPLIAYIIEASKASGVFDEIYINSEAEVFAEIAKQYGVKFYKRPEEFSLDKTINDEFAFDFIQNIPGDILVQLLPTSPLITPEEIRGFVNEMITKAFDALVSVSNHQIACVFNGKPVNFSLMEPHRSSQNMIPVQLYVGVLMAWTYKSFNEHMGKYGFAYHGADGRTEYYVLKGLTTIDIDNEEDFNMAEVAISYRNNPGKLAKRYYGDK